MQHIPDREVKAPLKKSEIEAEVEAAQPDDKKLKRADIGRAVAQSEKILIASLYWDILAKTIPSDLRKVHDYGRDKNLKMIVMMDSNAHLALFGSLEQNERGTIIENKAGRLASSVTVLMGG